MLIGACDPMWCLRSDVMAHSRLQGSTSRPRRSTGNVVERPGPSSAEHCALCAVPGVVGVDAIGRLSGQPAGFQGRQPEADPRTKGGLSAKGSEAATMMPLSSSLPTVVR